MKLLPDQANRDLGHGQKETETEMEMGVEGKNCCIISEAHSESCCGQKSSGEWY